MLEAFPLRIAMSRHVPWAEHHAEVGKPYSEAGEYPPRTRRRSPTKFATQQMFVNMCSFGAGRRKRATLTCIAFTYLVRLSPGHALKFAPLTGTAPVERGSSNVTDLKRPMPPVGKRPTSTCTRPARAQWDDIHRVGPTNKHGWAHQSLLSCIGHGLMPLSARVLRCLRCQGSLPACRMPFLAGHKRADRVEGTTARAR